MSREKAFLDKQVIIDEALRQVESDGFAAFSTRRLAGGLGSSVMTLYNYYENRDAIVRDTIIAAFGILWIGLPERLEPYFSGYQGSPLRVYMAVGEWLREFAEKRPRLYEFLFDSDTRSFLMDSGVGASYRQVFDRLKPLVTDRRRIEELHDQAYLFLVLVNALILSNLKRVSIDEGRYKRLLGSAYDSLLSRFEPLVPPPAPPPPSSRG